MLGTVSLAWQLWVWVTLVDIRSAKVCQPRLDTPPWDNHENWVVVVSPSNPLALALRFQLSTAGFGRMAVRVRDDDQVRVALFSNDS